MHSLKIGKSGIISDVGGDGALRRRLLDMGLTPKNKGDGQKGCTLGDPIELYLRGYELTIRKDDANNIEITEVI